MYRSRANQHVDMIRDAFDDQWRPVHFADDAAEIGEQVVAEFGFDQRPPLRGREDEMQQDVSRCMGHFLTPLPGLAVRLRRLPTPCGVGGILSPLRGCSQ